ncbi:sugar ABC transporter permease (plasmid) [Mesorhizobium sp. B2-1-8]|uniref:carbohydrate ABC transporter permease n=1 Tax=Mesorhizobium sp. B2-1-8 TaxID=2589967 RepID=UPI001126DD0A|nr:sugar ABC transporter permease [Mesorhizobium sp. B2-1-8]UCI22797.1 sugar ABC transporter permease [Mesorhizobium sp. B2-1-8]
MKVGTVVAGPARGLVSARPSRRKPRLGVWFEHQFHVFALAPTVIVMLIIFGLPLAFSFFLSLKGWTPSRSIYGGDFAGAENYRLLSTDPVFVHSLVLTIAYTIVTVTIEMLLGLGAALLLNKDLPFVRFIRTLILLPMMMTPIVAALCWKLLLDPEYGFVNFLLGQKLAWVGDPQLAPIAVTLVNVWQNVPYVAVLLLAGLRSLPTDPAEAASIDGASRLQTFWYVTLPALRPSILVALLLRTIFEFRSFENVYVLTGGGPGGSTNLISMFTYALTFSQFDFTLGAAASWVMLVASLCLCAIPIMIFRLREKV